MRVDEKVRLARQLERARRRHHRGRVPDRLRGRRRGRPAGGAGARAPGRGGAGALRARRRRSRRRGRSRRPAARRIHTFIATSDLHLTRKLRMTREACLDAAVDAVTARAAYTDDVEFSAEDATRSDRDFLCRVVEAVIDAGATTINLPDTVGYSTPDEIGEFFRDGHHAACRTRTARSSARTATTISAWRSRTRWRRSAPARARSSARSTASASAPATRRSKKS